MPKIVALPVSSRRNTGASIGEPEKSAGHESLMRRGRFIRGTSGNPGGRPRGSANKSHAQLRAILAADAESVLHRVITAALSGDMAAARLILDRVLPRRSCRPSMSLDLPVLNTASDVAAALTKIVHAAAEGTISTAEAEGLAGVIDTFTRTFLLQQMASEIAQLRVQLEEHRG